MKGGKIDVDFSGDFESLPDFNRKALVDYINRFIKRYKEDKDIFGVSVYIKRFEAKYLGKPLIFCNMAVDTIFGSVSAASTGWGLKQAIKQSIKSLTGEVHKIEEKEFLGVHAPTEILA